MLSKIIRCFESSCVFLNFPAASHLLKAIKGYECPLNISKYMKHSQV